MSPYRIILEKPVIKFLQSHNDIAERFFVKAKLIENNPFDSTLDIKKLKWSNTKYRLRIGKYRFLFRIEQDTVVIYFYDADSRWDIYT
jgi:mRNA interferase RelE/StbE